MKYPTTLTIFLFVIIIPSCVSSPQIVPTNTIIPTVTFTQTPSQTHTYTKLPTSTHTITITHTPQTININNVISLVPLKIIGKKKSLKSFNFSSTAISPLMDTYIIDFGDVMSLWNVSTEKQIGSLIGHKGENITSKYSPNGQLIASGDWDYGQLFIWDSNTGKLLHDLSGKMKGINKIVFSPDSGTLITGSAWIGYDSNLLIWDVNNGEYIRNIPSQLGFSSMAFTTDGKILAVSSTSYMKGIFLYDTRTWKYIRSLVNYLKYREYNLTYSPDDSILISNDERGLIIIRNVETGKVITSFFTGDPSRRWGCCGDLGRDVTLRTDEYRPNKITFSPDGKILAIGYTKGSFVLWDIEKLQPIFIYRELHWKWYDEMGNHNGIKDLVFSPDGKIFASVNINNTITLWGIKQR